MTLPNLKLYLVPSKRCMRCGQIGYVHDRTTLCLACTNIGLLRWARTKLRPSQQVIPPPALHKTKRIADIKNKA